MADLSGAELEAEFNRVVSIVQNLPKSGGIYQPSNDEKLAFYSLYKQATVGPCNTPRPGMLDFVGKAKWDAWNALGNMSKEEAMREYIKAFNQMEEKINKLAT